VEVVPNIGDCEEQRVSAGGWKLRILVKREEEEMTRFLGADVFELLPSPRSHGLPELGKRLTRGRALVDPRSSRRILPQIHVEKYALWENLRILQ
jgi:hypothetical protein